MECKRIEEILSPYIEDELSAQEKQMVEEHLKKCPKCVSLLSFMREVKTNLEGLPEIEVSDNLLSRLYNIPKKKKKILLNLNFLLRPSVQPILAAATVILIMISLYMFNPDKNLINNSLNRRVHQGYNSCEKLYAKAESLTDSLSGYKSSALSSLKNIELFGENED